VVIARDKHVSIFIDDKIQVLKHFTGKIELIWFCDEQHKIDGTRKYHPELFKSLNVTRTWIELLNFLTSHG
jgi:hypothetical protein